MRIFEVAKKLGLPTKELMTTIKQLGMKASHHTSTLSEEETHVLFAHLKAKTKMVSKAAPKAKKTMKAEGESPPSPVKAKTKTALRTTPKLKRVAKGEEAGLSLSESRLAFQTQASPAPSEPVRLRSPLVSPTPSVEKKSFILIKKKVAPEPAAPPPVVPAPPVEMVPEPPILTSPPPLPALPPLVSEVLSPLPVPSSAAPIAPSAQMEKEGVAPVLKPTPVLEEATEKKEEKKKGKGELKPELKKGLIGIGRHKEKAKKGLITSWDMSSVSSETQMEKRKWQDFRPTHKRQEHRPVQKGQSPTLEVTKPRRKVIKLYEGLTVREFSELVGQKVPTLISKLMEMGKAIPINQPIGLEEALFLSEEFGVKAELVSEKTEEEILRPPSPKDVDDPSRLTQRPPVVTIMGHVDHGKTSLLDAIRQTKVMEGEAGGITQHIGAYTVTVHDKTVTFIDTPGHEAFTAMRARGAKVTDIVILVVAADDGVMPQTVEAINHAKAANVPIIVAINKIDKPEANPERVKTALTEYELVPEAWGGKTIFAEISAKKKVGLDHLLEMILLQAEVLELKGNPHKPMGGVIIEAKLDRGRGPVATVLVQEGTLKIGDAFVAGSQAGRVRALINDMGEKVKEANPATPVEVIGFLGVPSAGDTFVVTVDERVAKEVAQERMHRQRLVALAHTPRTTLSDFYQKIKEGEVKELRLVIKADVQGSAGALSEAIEKLSTSTVKVRVIHKGVGGISESDVLLSLASDAILIGFSVRPDPSAAAMAEKEKIDLRLYSIIYDAIEDVKRAMEGLLSPTYKEKVMGRADVRKTFQIPRVGMICGCQVISGVILRAGTKARVIRDSVVAYEGKISSLRRFKDDVKEVAVGFECGIGIENFNDIKIGDVIEVYTEEEVAAKLDFTVPADLGRPS